MSTAVAGAGVGQWPLARDSCCAGVAMQGPSWGEHVQCTRLQRPHLCSGWGAHIKHMCEALSPYSTAPSQSLVCGPPQESSCPPPPPPGCRPLQPANQGPYLLPWHSAVQPAVFLGLWARVLILVPAGVPVTGHREVSKERVNARVRGAEPGGQAGHPQKDASWLLRWEVRAWAVGAEGLRRGCPHGPPHRPCGPLCTHRHADTRRTLSPGGRQTEPPP